MLYFLDTNILIYWMKNNPVHIAHKINNMLATDQLVMSFVSYAELLMGAERSRMKAQVLQQLNLLTGLVPVVYAQDSAICEHYAQQFTQLKRLGTPIGANDLWIACHVLAENATLVTHNVREFNRIEGLRVEDWV